MFRRCLNKSFATFTSFLGDCHNFCSEFVLDVGKLKEMLTAFGNSSKKASYFFANNCEIVKFHFCGMKSKRTTQQKLNNRSINKRHLLLLNYGLIAVRIYFFFTAEAGPVKIGIKTPFAGFGSSQHLKYL